MDFAPAATLTQRISHPLAVAIEPGAAVRK